MIQIKKPLERCRLEKTAASTDPRYGAAPEARSIAAHLDRGVVNIDKPAGPTSHEVVAWITELLHIEKAAHTGTLDPKVTGVLPVLLGVATKLADTFLGDKEYVCLMKLHREVDEDILRTLSGEFVGEIYQRPPLKSAVKRQIRVRTVHSIEILEVEGKNVLMRVGCEAGTYVRMLCHHIGLALGVGAHLSQLRRTKSFPFDEDNLTTLQDLKDAYVFYEEGDERMLRDLIMPMEYALGHIAALIVKDTAVDAICHGADLTAPGIARIEEGINRGNSVVLYTLKGEAVGIGEATMNSEEMYRAERGICVETTKVFMKPGIYPKGWRRRAEVAEW
ncbi:MAG: RNA-guided pseudouridylation complex pseudouridine synthase subunit Cbf5 [Methanophagales archaeon ANME-1-THS]|nr:MAG: RNA-guided pseudouridylation complex pseudouridine synthase subunit Cbf5 [Methanophagales archaeon ANME-1-THS]